MVTESGLVFGAGGDNQVRAWDSDTGKQLWSSRFGGSFLGSLVMYEMDGRQYLLVPAASSAGGRGRGGPPAAAPAAAAVPARAARLGGLRLAGQTALNRSSTTRGIVALWDDASTIPHHT